MTSKENESENSHFIADQSEEVSQISNIDANDLDEETIKKLRGDTIGDTLYSQSFILKTILQFSDLKWDEEVEEHLCFLWDMTVEKDVCSFLLEISFPSLATSAVLNYRDNQRFIEIVIGILGNIFCSGCENGMTSEEISSILSWVDSDDHLILIQLMRFISASLDTNKNLIALIDKDFIEKICFILKNSINSDLLLKTLECVAKLTVDFKMDESLIDYSLYESVLVSYQTLTRSDSHSFEPDTKEKLLTVRYLLEVITNICSYIDRYKKNSLLLDIQKDSNIFTYELIKILKFFSRKENMLPVTDEIIFFLSAIMYTYTNLKLSYIPEIFVSVTNILLIIVDFKDEIEELYQSVLELECYLISSTQYNNIKKDLRSVSRQKVKKILNLVNENYKKFESIVNVANVNEFIQCCK